MIRLFVSDIDGCLALPYQAYRLSLLSELARLASEAGQPGSHAVLPGISLCSGRAFPYVESMTQVLGLQIPVLFEAGVGMFDPVKAEIHWHKDFDSNVRDAVSSIISFVDQLIDGTSLNIDHAKVSQAALVGTDQEELTWAAAECETFVRREHPEFRVYATPISVDVVHKRLAKENGLAWLAEVTGISMSSVAYIGDTGGDLAALDAVGLSYAPANAHPDVRAIVDVCTAAVDVEGVLSAYWDIIRRNEAESKRPRF